MIGTGASAYQFVPEIAPDVGNLTVFQRTPNYAVPAHNGPMDPAYMAAIKADYDGLRARQMVAFSAAAFRFDPNAVAMETEPQERLAEYERRWAEGGRVHAVVVRCSCGHGWAAFQACATARDGR